ncbi:MAG: transporter suffix domain-containing protein [Desulfofustis sp.]|nr:transporter suffix domain-containing protein [Desulfofustis sp.]
MTNVSQVEVPKAGWRLKLGVFMLSVSILLPLLGVPLLAIMGLSTATVATASGALLISAEVLGVAAIAIMGKSGYAYIKNRVFEFLKQHGPPQKVSRGRYRIGLVLFCLPLLLGWLSPYISKWIPGLLNNPLPYATAGDILIVNSLAVLGGDFWDKIRSLFIHNAEVNFYQNAISED